MTRKPNHLSGLRMSSAGITEFACAITGIRHPRDELLPFSLVREPLAAAMRIDHPGLKSDDFISREALAEYRSRAIETLLREERGEISDLEHAVIESLRRHETLGRNIEPDFRRDRTLGERVSDSLADIGGSWTFIISFGLFILAWIALNLWMAAGRDAFDPYPFILLNLVLSCLAAVQAPIIMMSQNRQEARDRMRAENDYRVNLKAELEIRHLHEKIDHLLVKQWERLTEIQRIQVELLEELSRRRSDGG